MKGDFGMDVAGLGQLISTCGFPIASCIAMGWFVYVQTNNHRTEVAELNAQHKEELQSVSEAINNNTIALTKLCERMGDNNEH